MTTFYYFPVKEKTGVHTRQFTLLCRKSKIGNTHNESKVLSI